METLAAVVPESVVFFTPNQKEKAAAHFSLQKIGPRCSLVVVDCGRGGPQQHFGH